MPDMVEAPPHYNSDPSGVECIEIVEHMHSPLLANVVRYLWRYQYKWNAAEDCDKAAWYVSRFQSGGGLRAPHSGAAKRAPFQKWRAETIPSLSSAAITMAVLMDSGQCSRAESATLALLDVIREIGEEARRAASTETA